MWSKKGVIFKTDNNQEWMVSHACVPTSILLNDKVIRIYFAPRNKNGQSIPTFIDVDAQNPKNVLYVHDKPIMSLGKTGSFDDGGIMPCSIVRHDNKIYLYYVGWNPSVSVPYRNAIGLAISEDGGYSFQRAFEGPVVDRNLHEPYFTASPCVYIQSDTWHMWYASAIGFIENNNKNEPIYVIKYATSKNGIEWERNNITCIHQKNEYEANARPTVLYEEGKYKMWFCYRGSFDYRDGKDSYRIGYAESTDAINWIRKDEFAGLDSCESDQWDSLMQTYPNVLTVGDTTYMFYNGNGFGQTGIGYAVLSQKNK